MPLLLTNLLPAARAGHYHTTNEHTADHNCAARSNIWCSYFCAPAKSDRHPQAAAALVEAVAAAAPHEAFEGQYWPPPPWSHRGAHYPADATAIGGPALRSLARSFVCPFRSFRSRTMLLD